MEYITEREIDRIADDTGKTLAAEKKVQITIRPEGDERFWEGGVNGHFFRIRTDTPVNVPESLARQIALSRRVLEECEQRLSAYRKGGGKKVLL